MDDDDFGIGEGGEDSRTVPLDVTHSSPPNKPGVIMRVLHTRTEIRIYPDGSTFQNSRSWFEGQTYDVKKKEKKKPKETQKAITMETEEY